MVIQSMLLPLNDDDQEVPSDVDESELQLGFDVPGLVLAPDPAVAADSSAQPVHGDKIRRAAACNVIQAYI
jgi:hypothetical protein